MITKPIVFFDGHCGLCNRSIDYLLKRDKGEQLLFSPLQGKTAQALIPEEIRKELSSFVFYTEGKIYLKSTASIRAFAQLGGWRSLAILLLGVPTFFRDLVYNWVAKRRYKIWGRTEICRVPEESEKLRFLD